MKSLRIVTTSNCNNNCIFCIFKKIRKEKNKLTISRAKSVMKDYKKNGFTSVFFTGGEPTLYQGLEELVEYAHNAGYDDILIGSNGINFKDIDYCKKIISLERCKVAISLYSTDYKINNYLAQNDEHFSSAIKGIFNLKELNIDTIVRIIVTQKNYKDLLHLSQFLNNIKVSKIQFQFYCMVNKDNKREADLVVKLTELEPYIESAICFCIKNRQDFDLLNFPFCFLKKYNQYNSENFAPEEAISFDGEDFIDCIKQINDLKIKKDSCRDCFHNDICGGVWKYYIDSFGWDELS